MGNNFWKGFEKKANLAKMIAGLPSRRQLSTGGAKAVGNRIQAVHPRPQGNPVTAPKPTQPLSPSAQYATQNITRKRYADIK